MVITPELECWKLTVVGAILITTNKREIAFDVNLTRLTAGANAPPPLLINPREGLPGYPMWEHNSFLQHLSPPRCQLT